MPGSLVKGLKKCSMHQYAAAWPKDAKDLARGLPWVSIMLKGIERDDPFERVVDERETMNVGDHICVAENSGFDFNDIIKSFCRTSCTQMQYQTGCTADQRNCAVGQRITDVRVW